MKNVVHIVGTGTIGEPLIGLFTDFRQHLGIDEVTFHKRTPMKTERAKVAHLMSRGAALATGNDNKEQSYNALKGPKGFLAQGSEFGFGKMYARGINDQALIPGEDRFLQIVSCNTHNIAVLVRTLGDDGN